MQLPTANANNSQQSSNVFRSLHVSEEAHTLYSSFATASKHRGFAFVTFSSSGDAQDAIDNMDLNELRGRVLKVNLARPMKGPSQMSGNRAGASSTVILRFSLLPPQQLTLFRSFA